MALKVKGDILWGILVATVAALLLGVTKLPTGHRRRRSTSRTFFAPFQTGLRARTRWRSSQIFTPALLLFVFAIMLTDFFDTMGTVISVGEQAGFVDEDGKVPGIRSILRSTPSPPPSAACSAPARSRPTSSRPPVSPRAAAPV